MSQPVEFALIIVGTVIGYALVVMAARQVSKFIYFLDKRKEFKIWNKERRNGQA